MPSDPLLPEIALFDRQHAFGVDLSSLRRCARAALPLCIAAGGPGPRLLADLQEIEVSFVDDPEIARVHDDFMGIPGATDVITFDHGEIVISTDTADRNAAEFGHPLDRELILYLIHGLLHLNGHEDATTKGAKAMKLSQERILSKVLPG